MTSIWWRQLAEVQAEQQNGEERIFKWLWTWQGCCARQTDLEILEIADFLPGSLKLVWKNKQNNPVSGICMDESALLASEENGQSGSKWFFFKNKALNHQCLQ